MTHTIDLTEAEEARLLAANRRGGAPDKLLKQLVTEYLPENAEPTLREILAPVHAYSREHGYTEEEIGDFVDVELAAYRMERRTAQKSNAHE